MRWSCQSLWLWPDSDSGLVNESWPKAGWNKRLRQRTWARHLAAWAHALMTKSSSNKVTQRNEVTHAALSSKEADCGPPSQWHSTTALDNLIRAKRFCQDTTRATLNGVVFTPHDALPHCLPRCLPRSLPECAFSCQLFLIALARGMHMAVVQLITHTHTRTHLKRGSLVLLPHLHIERACLSASLPAALDHFGPATTFYFATPLPRYSFIPLLLYSSSLLLTLPLLCFFLSLSLSLCWHKSPSVLA